MSNSLSRKDNLALRGRILFSFIFIWIISGQSRNHKIDNIHFGTQDGLTSLRDISDSRQFLPDDTLWVHVNGGNHAQFGWYRDQPGDNPVDISRGQQQEIIIEAMLNFLHEINS